MTEAGIESPGEPLDDLQFVERIFARATGRAVDPMALRELLDRLGAGVSRTTLRAEFGFGLDGHGAWPAGADDATSIATVGRLLAMPDDSAFVAAAWRLVAGVEPDAQQRRRGEVELASAGARGHWLRQLRHQAAAAGRPSPLVDVHVLDVDADTLRSPRLDLRRLLALPDEAFVHVAYRQLLGREPDLLGRQTYLRLLREGRHRQEILFGLAECEEARRMRGRIEGWSPARGRWHRVAGRIARAARRVFAPPSRPLPTDRTST